MQGKFKTKDLAVATVQLNPSNVDRFRLGGIFEVECFDKNGKLKWTEEVHNFVTNEGLNSMLGIHFNNQTQITGWFVGLAGTGQKAVGDELNSHAAWAEIDAYDSTARPDFTEGAASSQSISNTGNAASFSINGDATVDGAFLCSVAEGNSPGVLFCVSDFASSRTVADGDTMNITYTLNASDV